MNFVVTTGQHPTEKEFALAQRWSKVLGAPLAFRKNMSLARLKEGYAVDALLVVTKNGPVVHTAGGDFFFHLSMAELRIKNLINGKHDHMVAAMGLKEGMSVLDCTLGLATDALVASLAVGGAGKVVGLEASALIAFVTEYGLKNFALQEEYLKEAFTRIQVINIDFNSYLRTLPANSFDVVYFDPMFRQPIQKSSTLKPIRYLADNRPLAVEALNYATRIAKKRVVIKETHDSTEFKRLGISTIVGGKYSSISYGVIDTRDSEV
jgi:hypothetical protein